MIRLGVAVVLVFLSAAYGSKVKHGQLLFGLSTELRLVCSGYYTFSHTVEWTLNGSPIAASRSYKMTAKSLTVQPFGVGAGGIYRCNMTMNNQVTFMDTFQIQVVAPVTFDKCGGSYCTEEIDVSSLSPRVKSALFLSSSLSYTQGVHLAGQVGSYCESTNETQWRIAKSSDVNLEKYCVDVDSSVCSLARCDEEGACRISSLLNRAARETTNGRLNKSITLDVNRLERELIRRKNSVTVLLRVNLPYRTDVLGTRENWVTVKAFRLHNFPASIHLSSPNCTESDVCKFIANEGDSLTVCNDIEVKGGGNPIMQSSWMVTMNSRSFNASLCKTEASNNCLMSSVVNMSVHSRWGRCLVVNNVTEKQNGLRLKYKLTASPQMKVTGLLESKEMVIHVMTDYYLPLNLHKVLAYQIKTNLVQDNIKAGSPIQITLPFDKITFTGGLATLGYTVEGNPLCQNVYGIKSCSSLRWYLGSCWHMGALNRNKTSNLVFSYVDPMSVRFQLKRLDPVREVLPTGPAVTPGGEVLVFTFRKLIGVGKDQWDAVTRI